MPNDAEHGFRQEESGTPAQGDSLTDIGGRDIQLGDRLQKNAPGSHGMKIAGLCGTALVEQGFQCSVWHPCIRPLHHDEMCELKDLVRTMPFKIAIEGISTHQEAERFIRIFPSEGLEGVITPGWSMAMKLAVIHNEARLVSDGGLHECTTQFRRSTGLVTMHGLLERDKVDAPDTERLLHV